MAETSPTQSEPYLDMHRPPENVPDLLLWWQRLSPPRQRIIAALVPTLSHLTWEPITATDETQAFITLLDNDQFEQLAQAVTLLEALFNAFGKPIIV